ncbi:MULTISPECIES: glycosyltransferase family A protein [unclassified Pseudoalteromonas]|uniref:glycosyltransferase family A protein n=1 Tax=unclassified Pseudoalteromonas TaxID=194690 RepID=UPI00042A58E3|nr:MULTISPECIES: glycosyltransferase family A protein [unclassified Pseudoalteromonas]
MNIQILMATMAKSCIGDIDWKNKCIVSPLLLINQSDFEGTETLDDITMISKKERGSSKSRNLAIENASGDICIIADDDVSYLENYESIVKDAYIKYPDADIITFQIQTTEGKPFKPNYSNEEYYHTKMSILKCASIEITFKRESIIKSGLKLDLEFGLGSKYRVHDEIIFLKDALDNGLKCVYIPLPIVIHPPESSGTDYNEQLLFSKGAAFYRLFGISGLLYDLAFSIKKYSEYKNVFSFIQCLRLMVKGTLSYSKEQSK